MSPREVDLPARREPRNRMKRLKAYLGQVDAVSLGFVVMLVNEPGKDIGLGLGIWTWRTRRAWIGGKFGSA